MRHCHKSRKQQWIRFFAGAKEKQTNFGYGVSILNCIHKQDIFCLKITRQRKDFLCFLKWRNAEWLSFVISKWLRYTVLHMFMQLLFWAGNQSNHQNFDPPLLSKNLWLFFMGLSKKQFFFSKKKNPKWPTQKNLILPNGQFSIFFAKLSGMGPWVSRIDWCEGHWFGSTYMAVRLSDIRPKTGKKWIFGAF